MRFRTREGVRGRSGRFFFLGAMKGRFDARIGSPAPPGGPAGGTVPRMPRAARTAVTVVFFASGAAYGSFVSRIPALKETLGAGEAELGLVLLAGAIGSVVFLPVAGWLTGRLGSRLVTRAALAAVAVSLPLLALAPSLLGFALVFALFGACTSTLDLAMNAHGVAVEERYARPIFSSFHASWSVGGLVGRRRSAARRPPLGVSPLAQFSGVALGIAVVFVWSSRRAAAGRGRRASDRLRLPHGPPPRCSPSPRSRSPACSPRALRRTGAASTWTSRSGPAKAAATAGFAAFAATMTLGRLVGDRLTERWGPVSLTRRAGLLAAVGMAVALGAGDAVSGVVGFACLGAGLATVVPTVFRAAGRRAASPGAGIAAVSTVGYSAFLVGPPAIGFLAEAVGLRAALTVLIALCLLIAALAGATRVA